MVAENARKLILDKGLKKNFVALKAGYEPKKFYRLLDGSAIIKDEDIVRIAKALEVTPNQLFGMKS